MPSGLRRDKYDTPVRNPESDRAKIAADVEAYLAAGNQIDVRQTGDTGLIGGVPSHLVSTSRRGGINGSNARWGKKSWGYGDHNSTKQGQR